MADPLGRGATAGRRPVIRAVTLVMALVAAAPVAGGADWLSRPWPVAWLRSGALELEATVGRVETPVVDLEAVRAPLRAHDGIVRLAGVRASLSGAPVLGQATLDLRAGQPGLALELHAAGVPLSAVKPLAALVRGGEARLTLTLEGHGATPRAWLAAAGGRILITAEGGELADDALDRLARDAVTALVHALNPLDGDGGHATLECFVARFEVADGVAVSDGGIGLETARVSVIGGGRVELASGALDLVFRPRAKEGLRIGAGDLASLVRVGGTLTRPELVPNATGLLKKGASWGAAVATLGLTKLAEIAWDQIAGRQGACQRALGASRAG